MKKKTPYHQPQPGATDPSQCNGCGVCMLSCPVWNQHHTKMLTYCGRNRALIGGATEADLAASARACILCGSCEPLCPMGIRTQQTTIALRRSLAARGLLPKPDTRSGKQRSETPGTPRILLPGKNSGRMRNLPRPCSSFSDNVSAYSPTMDTTLHLRSKQARRSTMPASRHSYYP